MLPSLRAGLEHTFAYRPRRSHAMACVVGIAVLALAGSARAEDAAASGPRWSTRIGSLTLGAGDETATFRDVRSTCNALRLALVFGSAASGVRACLPAPETRRILLQVEAGRVTSSRADPDDDLGRCATTALAGAHLEGLTCTLEASVSR
jgi:hypothetical protein